MKEPYRVLVCLLSALLLAGCTIAEPAYSPVLEGYSMIDEPNEPTLISDNDPIKKRKTNSS